MLFLFLFHFLGFTFCLPCLFCYVLLINFVFLTFSYCFFVYLALFWFSCFVRPNQECDRDRDRDRETWSSGTSHVTICLLSALCTCHDNSSISHNWFVVDHLFVIYFPFIPLDRLVVPLVDFNRLVVILCEWRVGRLTGWVHCMTVWMWLYLWSVWFCSLTVLYFINIILFYFLKVFYRRSSFFQWEHEGVWRHL